MKQTLFRIVTKVTIFATVFLTVLGAVTPSAYAANFDDVEWKLSRLQASTSATSTFTIDLPSTVDFGSTNSDTILLTFPSGFTLDSTSNWTTSDFNLSEGGTSFTVASTSLTVASTTSQALSYTCTSAYAIAYSLNVADRTIGVRRCPNFATYTPLATTGSVLILDIYDGSSGGEVTNSTAGNNKQLDIAMTDETIAGPSDQVATSIIAADSASPSGATAATSTLTFALTQDAGAAGTCNSTSQTSAMDIGWGTLQTTIINDATSTICTYLTTNSAGDAGSVFATVYGWSLKGGLQAAGGTYLASTVYSTTNLKTGGGAFSIGTTADVGLCVLTTAEVGTVNKTGVFSGTQNSGACTYNSGAGAAGGGALTQSPSSIWTSGATGEASTHLLPRISIKNDTAAGTYTDTWYFVAAGTF